MSQFDALEGDAAELGPTTRSVTETGELSRSKTDVADDRRRETDDESLFRGWDR